MIILFQQLGRALCARARPQNIIWGEGLTAIAKQRLWRHEQADCRQATEQAVEVAGLRGRRAATDGTSLGGCHSRLGRQEMGIFPWSPGRRPHVASRATAKTFTLSISY